MSALVLGKRSTSCFFEELHRHPPAGAAATSSPQPSSSKRVRFGASPHPPFSAPSPCPSPTDTSLSSHAWDGAAGVNSSGSDPALLDHLRSLFPYMDQRLLERALEDSTSDLDSAIRSLKELHLGSMDGSLQSAVCNPVEGIDAGINTTGIGASEGPSSVSYLPADGSQWVELLVREMIKATDVNDARVRASKLLEVLEKSIMAQASSDVAQTFLMENGILREQIEGLLHDNNILKRAVAIQHECQKEIDERNEELQHLKQVVAQYQDQLRTLEINNYVLSMHLRQAQQGSSIPRRFHPDVF